MFQNITHLIYLYIRPIMKWLLHRFTRLSELQRICYGAVEGAPRTKAVELSLSLSRTQAIKMLLQHLGEICRLQINENSFYEKIVDPAVKTIIQCKRIDPRYHPDFVPLFRNCAEQIWGYQRLYHTVERLRTTQYDCDNLDHERKLLELWDRLMPGDALESRITKRWQDIGFQGDDPKTDFRGMGMLGLENLLFFARDFNGAARHVLSHSLHPQHGYTFAIVGINLTSMAYKLLKSGAAKTHFYNSTRDVPQIVHFHYLYCYLFYEFDRYWMKCKPSSIMDFSYINKQFETNILKQLAEDKTYFRINLAVENV